MRTVVLAALAAVVAAGLAGCQTAVDTASGSPEVTIPGIRPDQVKPVIVGQMLNTRLRIKTDTQYSLVFEKPEENIGMNVLFATGFGPPVHRVNFAIAEVPGGTRIVADSSTISNSGTAFERKTGWYVEFGPERLQAMLNNIESSVAPPPPPIMQPRPQRRAPPVAQVPRATGT